MTNDTTNNLNQAKSSETIVSELKRQFCQKLDALAYGSSHYEVFRDWAEIAAISLRQLPYHAGYLPKDERFETVEARYLKLAGRHEREKLNEFAALLGIVQLALAHQWCDFLGAIYTEMEMSGTKSKQSNGEFFTPYPIARLSAKMILHDCEEVIERQGYLTLSEPACGAGAMVIAVCEVIAQKGYAPEKVAFFEAVDINPLFCHLAFVQFASLGLSGVVCHGDTLKNEIWERWKTPQYNIWRCITGRSPLENRTLPSQPTTSPIKQLGLFVKSAGTDKVA